MRTRRLWWLATVPFVGAACTRGDDAAARSDSAAGVAATAATDVGAVRHAIETTNARFADAAKRGDTAVVGAIYADDVVVMMPNEPAQRGRDAALKSFASAFTRAQLKEFNIKTDDVQVGGDLAVETGTYEMTMQAAPGREVKDKGKYVVVWKRQGDGSWKIVRDIFNTDIAPPKS
jgi:uncharacterized protein (TIGR02246 family)